MRFSRAALLFLLLLFPVACQRQIPAPPAVTVAITVVDDQQALDVAVGEALTATQQQNIHITETVLALGGITLTPTPTSTYTPVPPSPTPTRFLPPTPTPPPTATPSPTFAPLPTNTPATLPEGVSAGNGRIRVLHVWQTRDAIPLNVYLDDLPVASSLSVGQATPYQSVQSHTVRVTLREPSIPGVEAPLTPEPPLLSQVVDVPAGGGVSVLIADLGQGLTLVPVVENLEPLATNQSRLMVLQANPDMLRTNVLLTNAEAALAYNLDAGQMLGTFDLPSQTYSLSFYDADIPDTLLGRLDGLVLLSRMNYLLVLLPLPFGETGFTDHRLFVSTTQRTSTDTAVRFVNAATNAGMISVLVDGVLQVNNLPVGDTSITVPVSTFGQEITLIGFGGEVLTTETLGPWPEIENDVDKIVLITDQSSTSDNAPPVQLTVFSQNARPSAIRANIRLIHALTGTTRALDLEIRSTTPERVENTFGVPQSQQGDTAWSPVIQGVNFAQASEYEARNPNIFDVRVIINSTQNVLATISNLQLLPGAVYDFIALPGGSQGVAKLVLIQPDVQVTALGINQADPRVIQEQVEAALTASAPAPGLTATPTTVDTATPTVSPVPTNTPRPSNTPEFKPPSVAVNPAPPNTVTGSFVLQAENFAPNTRYTISIDDGPENLSGSISSDGTLTLSITLPEDIEPGLHTVRICADCRLGGAQQEKFALFRVADPAISPTPTRER